jgi:hypothetical protein
MRNSWCLAYEAHACLAESPHHSPAQRPFEILMATGRSNAGLRLQNNGFKAVSWMCQPPFTQSIDLPHSSCEQLVRRPYTPFTST